MRLQTLVRAVFPPECLCCGARVESEFGLCGACWGETPFIFGAACDLCGVGLPGQSAGAERLICEECHGVARPWAHGRAVLHYAGNGRSLVLGLKHGDRAEVARAAGPWMARAGADLLAARPLIVPVPLHWRRLATRRFNQAALLARALAEASGCDWAPDALIRPRSTGNQDGRDREGRFRNVDAAIRAHPRRGAVLKGRRVLLVDDVMTSGATFSAAAQACHAAGADEVCVMALARVARDV
ncbi:double zinc ribbon domain-containing protein [Roseicyclus persicicus]|uniref:ComF family protein n=1 Tax=Roseicyclus persicicus TaxID=2650661 RepID=A0A7X6JZV6_9RHOB|nr:double zinc ribbon domain-containing protein [Roseibacterium persicicum]NKX45193.1 ComF family protein [Roseibacterium persicicum]